MSVFEPDETEPLDLAVKLFGPVDESAPPSRSRPDDYPGFESLAVLQTPGGRCRAGKSYRPDPSGLRRAIKVDDYSSGKHFLCTSFLIEGLEDIFDLLKHLSTNPYKFVVRGVLSEYSDVYRQHKITKETGYFVQRRSVKHHGNGGHFRDESRQLQMLDLDGVPLPNEMSVVADPEACIKWAVDNLFPSEFREASFVYQLSSSAGLTKRDDELNVHLWFFTNREYANEQLRAWAKWWNAKQQRKIIDPALFTEVQPHYTNDPELLDGLIDPLAGRRLGLIRRPRRTVKLYMPTAQEVAEELGSRQRRAAKQYSRARKTDAKRASKNLQQEDDSEPSPEPETEPESDGDPFVGGPYFDAVKLGPGWRGYLMAIGFEGHVRTQIRAAIGSYFYEHGSRGDRDLLNAEIARAIEESPFLDSAEPWSRSRQDARNYLLAPQGGSSNVDEMIVDIAARQAERQRFAFERCEPTWVLPTLTAEEAFIQIEAAISAVMRDALEWKERRRNPLGPWVLFEKPSRAAISCSTGTGKTEAMIAGIFHLLRVEQTARVAIAVPTHKLGQGLADRINKAYGSEIAAEWYGTDHPDPLAPDEKMCRFAEAARELISLGGKLQLLCSRRGEQMEYCPHHPAVAGVKGCGYKRQQTLEVRNRIRVWIVPATMLSAALPVGLKRVAQLIEGDFDLLVIDEAPWFNLLPNEPVKLPLEWLSPGWWAAQASRASDDQKCSAVDILTKIHSALAGHTIGEIPADVLASVGITSFDVWSTRRSVWKFKADLRNLVKPGLKHRRLKKALSAVGPRNQRVVAVAEALSVIRDHLSGKLAPSAVELTEENGVRYLRLRRRQDLHPAWLKAPTLYLDAADIGSFEIAKAWLPDLDLKVDARAKAPHMRVSQLVDSQMAYQKLVVRGAYEDASAQNNQEKLARVIASRGLDGLVICPKDLRLAWEKAQSLPPGWSIWNFGAIRGRDEARAVPQLVVVSRPLPSPGDAEIMTETIFGRPVGRLPSGEWYLKAPVGRLVADGTGRRALALRHPDPLVEAVRFAICEGELLQAVGRGRGVRRTADTPLEVLILTDVPIPIPVDTLVAWKELCDAGPLDVLAAKGVVPLDYEGIVAALPGWFEAAAKLKDWFRYRPKARSNLKAIKQLAREIGTVDHCEFSEISYIGFSIGDFAKLAAYSYRRAGSRQSNFVLVNGAMHADARAAVEAVLGPVADFEPAEKAPRRRPRRHPSSLDVASPDFLAQLMGRNDANPA